MRVYYTEAELVSFGNYLLSKERTNRILCHPEPTTLSDEERLEGVYDADVENWKDQEFANGNLVGTPKLD